MPPGRPVGLSVRLAVEDDPLDTAGPVREILDPLDDRFLVLNGDVVVEADLAAARRRDRGREPSALVEVDDTSAYGVVVLADDGRGASASSRSRRRETAPARTVNAGMYVLARSGLAGYPDRSAVVRTGGVPRSGRRR